MQAQAQAQAPSEQLTLSFYDGFHVPHNQNKARLTKTITFPRHIVIPHFGAFQRQVNALFAPFGITVEFGLNRQKRLQMTWVFPAEDAFERRVTHAYLHDHKATNTMPALSRHSALSDEEMNAFANVVFAFAGHHQG